MNRLLFLLALTVAVGCLIGSAPALEAPAHPHAVLKGVIVGFNPNVPALGVATQNGPVPVLVGRGTQVFIDGQRARLADLRPGMRGRLIGRPVPQIPAFRAGVIRVRSRP